MHVASCVTAANVRSVTYKSVRTVDCGAIRMADKGKYLRLTPGQKCQRCGGDNSFRQAGTKWCYACSKEIERRRARARRAHHKVLVLRDTEGHMNQCCRDYYMDGCTFCGKCGQRLRGRGGFVVNIGLNEGDML